MISTLNSAAQSGFVNCDQYRSRGWDLMEGDINGKLCLWHWWDACPCLAHVLCAWVHKTYRTTWRTGRIQKKQCHTSIRDASNELQEEKHNVHHFTVFFFSLSTHLFLLRVAGRCRLSQHAPGWRQGSHYRLSDIQCRRSFIPPGNLESPVHLTVGGSRHSWSRNPPSARSLSGYNSNNWAAVPNI